MKLDNAKCKNIALVAKKQKGNVGQATLDKQANIIRNIENNIEKENLKALVPESFRSLFKDEAGVTLGMAALLYESLLSKE